MSIVHSSTYYGKNDVRTVTIHADGNSRRERGATIAAAVRRLKADGSTVEMIGKPTYDEAYGFMTRTTARYRVTAAAVAEYTVGARLYFHPGTERAPFGTVIGEGAVIVTKVVDHGSATQHSPRFTYVVEALDGSGTQGTDARELSALAV